MSLNIFSLLNYIYLKWLTFFKLVNRKWYKIYTFSDSLNLGFVSIIIIYISIYRFTGSEDNYNTYISPINARIVLT